MKKRKGGTLVSQIHQVSGRVFHRLMQLEGLSDIPPAQGRILFALWYEDGLTPSELAKKTMLDKSTLTGVIDRLVKNGLVERVPSETDRRVVYVRRTVADREFEDRFVAVSRKMMELFYAGMEETEIDLFERTLERVLVNCIAAEKSLQDK